MISVENATRSILDSGDLGVFTSGDCCIGDGSNPGGGNIPGGGAFTLSSGESLLSDGGFAFFDGVCPSSSRSLGIVGGDLLDGGGPSIPGGVVGTGGITGGGGTCTIGPLGGGVGHLVLATGGSSLGGA